MNKGPFSSTLRMFLSVDIVGSTAFKQAIKQGSLGESSGATGNSPAEPWFSPIAQFYRGIESTFAKEWAKCIQAAKEVSWPAGSPPELWKSIGDELIYTKDLSDHREALSTLNAWMATVTSYRAILRKQFSTLDLKSTAWIAGFPVHNAEVIFRSSQGGLQNLKDEDDPVFSNLSLLEQYYRSGDKTGFTRDFIGPAIDTGFRLAQISTPRRLVISVELALVLVHAVRTQPPKYSYPPLRFFFEGRHSFKGVFGGIPYPVFWVDLRTDPELDDSEDELSDRKPLGTDAMLRFCHEFIRASDGFSFTPYIMGNVDQTFGQIPEHHTRRLDGLRSYWEREAQKRKDEEEAGLQKVEQSASSEQLKLLQSIIDMLNAQDKR